MRIITKQSDYYDSIQAYGQDQSVIYIRKPEELFDEDFVDEYYRVNNKTFWSGKVGHLYNVDSYRGVKIFTGFSVFFCGQRYNAIVTEVPNPDRFSITPIQRTHYNINDLNKYIDSLNLKYVKEYHHGWARKRGYKSNSVEALEGVTEFFAMNKTNDDLHFKFDVPVFVIATIGGGFKSGRQRDREKGVIKNPVLKDYEFAHVKDPFTAYQEIDMYISGVLGGKSPRMQEISDEVMKQQKGFGHKYAFKTMPTKKR